jgi:serine/threonine protein kinase
MMPDTGKKAGQPERTPRDAVTYPSDSFPTSNELDLFRCMVETISDRYEVLAEAGRGGMGVVYRARDRETEEIIALKALRPDLATDTRLVERFKRELRLARHITHKNVCRVYDLHRTPALCFVTMEFVEGENLRSVLQHRGALRMEEGVAVARQVCAALREAHKQGIVHRDLKPENVMLDSSGTVKVMDFGIARSVDTISTFTGGILGTPAYMAPEQVEGRPIDHRTDIYSLGLVLYEVFTGVAAFTADTPIALALKQVNETPVHPRDLEPSLPPILEKAILKCLEKDPGRRYQTAEELDVTLRQMLEPSAEGARTTPGGRQPWFITASAEDLPRPPRILPRTLFILVQALYVTFYVVALAKFGAINFLLSQLLPNAGRPIAEAIRVTALLGIALRLYLISGVAFDYKGLGNDFRRLSYLLIPLDALWALSPLLLLAAGKLGPLAFACVVALAFLPLSQRTLVRMAYAWVEE